MGRLCNFLKKEKKIRLGIIIPYRDRADHMNAMLPHTISFFRRNQNPRIEPFFCIVEQSDQVPFNRGALLNQGYLAVRDVVDCVCFHDVDYLPVWADYTEPNLPTRIVWWGLHERPIGRGTKHAVTAARHGLGGVSMVKNKQFEAVNGYSNQFWGWGFEDTDLMDRFDNLGIALDYRDGTFQALNHDSNGYLAHEVPTPEHYKNKQIWENKKGQSTKNDGLDNPIGTIVSKEYKIFPGLQSHESASAVWIKIDFSHVYSKTDVIDNKNS